MALAAAWIPTAAAAQGMRGSAQVQYQMLDNPGVINDRDLWLSDVRVDVTRRFEDKLDLSAQILFRDVSYAGRVEGTRTPRGSLRLTHRDFGATGSYRPARVTDPRGITSHEDELQFSAYAAKEGWPVLNGTWLRRSTQPGWPGSPNAVGLSRTLSASFERMRFGVRVGYADQGRNGRDDPRVRSDERRTWNGGATLRLGSGRANLTTQYDGSRTDRILDGEKTEQVDYHTLSANGAAQHSRRLASSLQYAFRRSTGTDGVPYTRDDHEGTALTRYTLTRALSVSAGGGVRSLLGAFEHETQWYLLGIVSGEGLIRPGWSAGAGVSRSLNWQANGRAHPIDTYQANTRMRLRQGIELTASGQVNVSDRLAGVQVDSLGERTAVVSQGSAALTLQPYREFTFMLSGRGYRSGDALLSGPAATSRSQAMDLRWNPSPWLQFTGSYARTHGAGIGETHLRVRQATAQWTPSRRLELSGSWWRSDEARNDPTAALPPGRETWNGRILAGLSRDLKATLLYSMLDPGRATRADRIEATLTLGLGRIR
ncbi:MAG TPA: hypothetical protein VFP58_05840 [Candidatus Eisenbacteria bacterium]|nr:hypothetical protein [Candidatus Eisenbacteria bacterium]